METRANFILIGLFTLAGIFGMLGFFVWLASVQFDRQYAHYGVLFDNVAGLDAAGDVLFNGVGVGKVTAIRIWENDPSLVFVAVEVDAATPVSTGTVAQLKSQGVTGVAYIELSGGATNAAPLVALDDGLPIIPSRRSSVQALVDDAPDLLTDASEVLAQIKALSGPDRQAQVTAILGNLQDASGHLDQALADISDITGTARDATAQITVFTERLNTIGPAIERTLAATDVALGATSRTMAQGEVTLATLDGAIVAGQAALLSAQGFIDGAASDVAAQVGGSLTGLDALSATAAAVLRDSQETLAGVDTAVIAATDAFEKTSALMDADLGPVFADLQSAAQQISTAVADIPQMARDVGAMIARADAVVAEVQRGVDRVMPELARFGSAGLSQVSQLAAESRNLVQSLQALVRRIDRDPAGFLLDDRVPTYRR